jgi:hypothetical protein
MVLHSFKIPIPLDSIVLGCSNRQALKFYPSSHLTPAAKAPDDWRTPKPGGLARDPVTREASWTAVALYRFFPSSKLFQNLWRDWAAKNALDR